LRDDPLAITERQIGTGDVARRLKGSGHGKARLDIRTPGNSWLQSLGKGRQ
jgi:hypothetical protein